ncbi:ABC1 kinase family protein [Metabacillus malikii]|uniref:Unusual protein kinase regulating ubiquinone biosynthesis (AarF/ABC1/UbiB family) n=1 Tax=Metabacillus malikii TaxID=1504265 RepID=A0ABT9ZKJ0_9BACI|nr:AarF/UbiB family protein [Metabacillus malikii]MDQ0232053.1 putative unusual protein kinase regulating ubiquinone biosynthesis (AarF/ABC1/UbiB family) [Metabacillus malikii]
MKRKAEIKIYRMWRVLSLGISILFRVYWYKLLKKSEAEKQALWERIGQQFRQTLFDLEGLLIKVGQLLSIRSDLLPKGFVKQLDQLVDKVPPSSWSEIKTVLETEWNASIDENLATIDRDAVASASIGEVYKAVLLDGTTVAIKVQRPTIQAIVRTDFRILSILFWFAKTFAPIPKGFINFNMLYKEMKHVIERELDFKQELASSLNFKERFEDNENYIVPNVFPSLCTSKILVMEWVDGAKITDIAFLQENEIDQNELAKKMIRLFLPQWLEAGLFHADPHSGNVLVTTSGKIILLDFGMVSEITKSDAVNFQRLIEAIFFKHYPEAVNILNELGFLIPGSDPKPIEKMLMEFVNFDFQQLKEMDLLAVKKEMNAMVQTLPIQVPTRFIFLGRAYITIEGILLTIIEDEELQNVAKPELIDWVNKKDLSKWKLVLKWLSHQPFAQVFRQFHTLINAPQRYIELKEKAEQRNYHFTVLENNKRHFFVLGIVGLLSLFIGDYIKHQLSYYGSFVLLALASIGYITVSVKQKKLLKTSR